MDDMISVLTDDLYDPEVLLASYGISSEEDRAILRSSFQNELSKTCRKYRHLHSYYGWIDKHTGEELKEIIRKVQENA